jgi:mRNA-degrading endonuclease YafQ of YafQ-DinJ toxin-antitoxin module
MNIVKTNGFKKDFAALPQAIQRRALKQLALFFENPKHPSLRIKKMQGYPDIWEGRISKGYRFTFTLEKEQIILRRIGPHDILEKP